MREGVILKYGKLYGFLKKKGRPDILINMFYLSLQNAKLKKNVRETRAFLSITLLLLFAYFSLTLHTSLLTQHELPIIPNFSLLSISYSFQLTLWCSLLTSFLASTSHSPLFNPHYFLLPVQSSLHMSYYLFLTVHFLLLTIDFTLRILFGIAHFFVYIAQYSVINSQPYHSLLHPHCLLFTLHFFTFLTSHKSLFTAHTSLFTAQCTPTFSFINQNC